LQVSSGKLPGEASGVADDSRKVKRGELFIAVRGWNSDGHDFLDAAAQRGAAVAIVEDGRGDDAAGAGGARRAPGSRGGRGRPRTGIRPAI